MVLVQKWPFFQTFFLDNIGQKIVFYDILKRQNAFLGYKNKKFKKSKNDIFSEVLTLGFGPKVAIFPTFFQTIQARKTSFTIFSKKNAFLGYKNKKFKKSKNCFFSRVLTHGFGPKMAIFPNFFFRQCRPEKCLFRSSGKKKRFSRL